MKFVISQFTDIMLNRIASHLTAGSSCSPKSLRHSCYHHHHRIPTNIIPNFGSRLGRKSKALKRAIYVLAAMQPPLHETDWRKDQFNEDENDEAYLKLTSEEVRMSACTMQIFHITLRISGYDDGHVPLSLSAS